MNERRRKEGRKKGRKERERGRDTCGEEKAREAAGTVIGMRSSGGRRALANEHTCRRATGAGVAAGDGDGGGPGPTRERRPTLTSTNDRCLPARLVLPPRPPSVHCLPKVVQQFARLHARLGVSATGAPRVPTRNSETTPRLPPFRLPFPAHLSPLSSLHFSSLPPSVRADGGEEDFEKCSRGESNRETKEE